MSRISAVLTILAALTPMLCYAGAQLSREETQKMRFMTNWDLMTAEHKKDTALGLSMYKQQLQKFPESNALNQEKYLTDLSLQLFQRPQPQDLVFRGSPLISNNMLASMNNWRNLPYAIINGDLYDTHRLGTSWQKLLTPFAKQHNSKFRSIGAVVLETNGLSRQQTVGTAFMVGNKQVMTAAHVAKDNFANLVNGVWTLKKNHRVTIIFDKEYKTSLRSPLTANVKKIVYVSDVSSRDVALLEVEGDGSGLPDAIPLPKSNQRTKEGEQLVVIGYPVYDERDDKYQQEVMFRIDDDIPWGILRVGGGRTIRWLDDSEFAHDTTTLGSNSGSPLFRLKDGEIVGIHIGTPSDVPAPGQYSYNIAVDFSKVRDLIK